MSSIWDRIEKGKINLSRREFLNLAGVAGVGVAALGLAGCAQNVETPTLTADQVLTELKREVDSEYLHQVIKALPFTGYRSLFENDYNLFFAKEHPSNFDLGNGQSVPILGSKIDNQIASENAFSGASVYLDSNVISGTPQLSVVSRDTDVTFPLPEFLYEQGKPPGFPSFYVLRYPEGLAIRSGVAPRITITRPTDELLAADPNKSVSLEIKKITLLKELASLAVAGQYMREVAGGVKPNVVPTNNGEIEVVSQSFTDTYEDHGRLQLAIDVVGYILAFGAVEGDPSKVAALRGLGLDPMLRVVFEDSNLRSASPDRVVEEATRLFNANKDLFLRLEHRGNPDLIHDPGAGRTAAIQWISNTIPLGRQLLAREQPSVVPGSMHPEELNNRFPRPDTGRFLKPGFSPGSFDPEEIKDTLPIR